MTYRLTALFALVAVSSALTQILVAQRGQRNQAPAASTANSLPFDPHDISGIWRNPGGFDPIIGMNRPPGPAAQSAATLPPGTRPPSTAHAHIYD